MTSPAPDDGRWLVVRNLEGRWSVAPADRPIPAGWTAEGAPATRDGCLARIETDWHDQRPLSLQREWRG